jgi:hypothetical protein
MKFVQLMALAAATTAIVTTTGAIDGNFASQILPGQAAKADWLGNLINRLPTPSGIYVNLNGHKYYFGDYSPEGEGAVVFKDGTWEVKVNGRVAAHGYGRTPDWVLKAIGKVFGPIPVY